MSYGGVTVHVLFITTPSLIQTFTALSSKEHASRQEGLGLPDVQAIDEGGSYCRVAPIAPLWVTTSSTTTAFPESVSWPQYVWLRMSIPISDARKQ